MVRLTNSGDLHRLQLAWRHEPPFVWLGLWLSQVEIQPEAIAELLRLDKHVRAQHQYYRR